LEEGRNGEIFYGSHSGGLGIINKNGEVINYPIEGGKAGILIFNIDIQEDNTAWIATNIGIYKFENEEFVKVALDESLGAETVFDIVVTHENAWCSSNIGLIRVSMNDLNSYLGGEIEQVPAKLFDRSDGMGSQECTGATRMTLSNGGKLWIPTLGGVSVLNPIEINENKQIPEVYITELITDFQNVDVNTTEKLSIDPGIVRYDLHFTSLSLIAPPKVRFKYRLNGIDDDWIDSGNLREAIYTNLPKGKYSFEVIASNNDGIWNNTGARLDFQVRPYFYEMTTFYILVVICIGLVIWGIIRWRIHNITRVNSELLKLNEELDRFVYSASHDLRAPLSSVMGLVGVAKLETTVKGKDQCLSMINDSIHKLDGFIDDIIDYSRNKRIEVKAENIDIENEIKDIYQELKYMDKDGAIDKRYHCNGTSSLVTDGRRLNIVLKNLISNAIRYHDYKKEDQYINVEIKTNGQYITIVISDNGLGIENEHLKNIFMMFYRADEGSKGSGLGLYIVKETIEKLNGTIDVQSKVKEGTTFTINIPLMKSA
jgi:signal transduction histidine kinase